MRPAAAPYGHHKETLKSMNEDRKGHQFCDLTLKVGNAVVSAHRSVLAAESEYFRSLFAQQAACDTSQEIDLTTVTEKEDHLEQIVSFAYLGSVEITSKNVLALAEMASIFQMKNLCKTIQQHMNETLSRATCLKYYLCAKKRGMSHIEGIASVFLKARFHDYYLYKEETLDITPDDLNDFLKDDFLQFCSISHILEFLTQWVLHHRTCKHVEVASEVITSIMEGDNIRQLPPLPKKEVSRLVTNLKSSLQNAGLSAENSETVDNFIEYFESALSANCSKRKSPSCEEEPVAKKRQIKKKQPGQVSQTQETEHVLFALAKRNTKTDVEEEEEEDTSSNSDYSEYSDQNEPLHICVYQPSSKTWFYYKQIEQSCVYVKPHVNSGPKCTFYVVGDYIVTYDQLSGTLHYYNHKSKGTKCKKLKTDFGDGFGVCQFAGSFFTVENGTLYMVNRYLSVRNVSTQYLQQVQFFGYRAKFANAKMEFDKMFMTFPVPVSGGLEFDTNHEFDDRLCQDVQIKVCSNSNEMIVIHSTFQCLGPASSVVFRASLAGGTTGYISGKVILYTKEYKYDLRECYIVEKDDRLLIVRDLSGNVKVLCEYVFSSEHMCYDTEYSVGKKDDCRLNRVEGFNCFPMSPSNFSANGTSRLWDVVVFQGSSTVLRSCDFMENEIKVTDHMSPPLSDILAVHETRVASSFLKKLAIVAEFEKI